MEFLKYIFILLVFINAQVISGRRRRFHHRPRLQRPSQILDYLDIQSIRTGNENQISSRVNNTLRRFDAITHTRNWRLRRPFNIFRSEKLLSRLPVRSVSILSKITGCQIVKRFRKCTTTDQRSKYRSIDGICNNLRNPLHGAAFSLLNRLLRSQYDDRLSTPIGVYDRRGLPSPRLVSTTLLASSTISQDSRVTDMVKTWGQFLDHDIASTPHHSNTACSNFCRRKDPCFPIRVPITDKRVMQRCLPFGRSLEACGTGRTSVFYDIVTPRQQVNAITAFVDASTVYGSSTSEEQALRDTDATTGRLLEGLSLKNAKPLLPFQKKGPSFCKPPGICVPFFLAGDGRVNENVQLLSMHTIWMREHNRVAKELKKLNTAWSGERIYQETRKIIGAQVQKITYSDYLPIIIGRREMRRMGRYRRYISRIDPSILNSFATSSFRFGHTQIKPIIARLDENLKPIKAGNLKLFEAFFAPHRLVREGGVDPIMRGLYGSPGKAQIAKERLTTTVTESLFNATHIGHDLGALNLQRGRDHGLPGYNRFRRLCGMRVARFFHQFREIRSSVQRLRLRQLYRSPWKVDLFTGSMLENVPQGQQAGPLVSCMLRIQFRRLREGDRYRYQRRGVFTRAQGRELQKASLARIICDNTDTIKRVPRNVFTLSRRSKFVACNRLPSINLSLWKSRN